MKSRRNFLKLGLFTGLFSSVGLKTSANTQSSMSAKPSKPKGLPINDAKLLKASTKTGSIIGDRLEQVKKSGDKELLYKFLYAMPKGGDIHHHLGGSMLPEMWWDLATDQSRNGNQIFYTRYKLDSYGTVPLLKRWTGPHTIRWMTIHQALYDSLEEDLKADFKPLEELTEAEKERWLSSVVLDSVDEGRNEFFEYHWPRLGSLLSDFIITSELLVENMRRYGAEGIRYIEVMHGPWNSRMPDGSYLTGEEYTSKILERLNQPDALETGVMIRFQTVVLRFADSAIEDVRKHFEFIDSHRELWRGINMAGREDDNRGFPARFTEVYDEMLRKYPEVGISIHAGESEKPDSYIFDTLRLGATRIGHGCNLIRDDKTMQMMRVANHLVEINLISNQLLKYVPDLDQHPFPIYFRQGIPCCLNTDDRGMWDSNMTDEFYVAVSRFNLSWNELNSLHRNSLEYSFLNEMEKSQLLAEYEEECEVFEKLLARANWEELIQETSAVTYGYGKNRLGLNL